MDLLRELALGFGVALSWDNLFYCFVGTLVGTLVGVLPGLGPLATLAMLLPITFSLPPVGALIMLAGIYYGAQYGGSTSAILVNVPGESSSFVTTLDGYQMARQGRAGPALAIAALGSFFAGTVATLIIAVLAPPMSRLALQFNSADYFSLMVLGLVAAVVLASGSLFKALAMVFVGLLLAMVGMDFSSGLPRLTFGFQQLEDGINFVPLAMGLFGIAEILRNLEQPEFRSVLDRKIGSLWPTRRDLADAGPAIARGTVIGSILGVLPGGGALLSSFTAYMVEKRLSREPDTFGRGNIRGVAAPESANNAGAQTSFIPLLTLGIPSNPIMALMIGAMTLLGVQPGPQVMVKQPELFWGIIASMWIGNAMLVVINLPLIGIWVRLLRMPYGMLFPLILLFCCIGVYSVSNSAFDVAMMAFFGLLGYALIKFGFEPAPLVLGFILGQIMELNLRRALLSSGGDFSIFIERPLSAGLLAAAALLLLTILFPAIRRTREQAFQE
jgi:TctA family transporter